MACPSDVLCDFVEAGFEVLQRETVALGGRADYPYCHSAFARVTCAAVPTSTGTSSKWRLSAPFSLTHGKAL